MPCVLGLVIAIAVGLLAVCVVTWTARCTGVTLWQYPPLARLRTHVAVRPTARVTGARANGSQEEPQQEYQAQPRHHDCKLRGGPLSSPTPPEDGVWKARTFVCYVPRLSAEERQRLLATWRDGHHAGVEPEYTRH
jgi:hypothetical protein